MTKPHTFGLSATVGHTQKFIFRRKTLTFSQGNYELLFKKHQRDSIPIGFRIIVRFSKLLIDVLLMMEFSCYTLSASIIITFLQPNHLQTSTFSPMEFFQISRTFQKQSTIYFALKIGTISVNIMTRHSWLRWIILSRIGLPLAICTRVTNTFMVCGPCVQDCLERRSFNYGRLFSLRMG